jgi:NaMN:DMB phosphoribosyltransferase
LIVPGKLLSGSPAMANAVAVRLTSRAAFALSGKSIGDPTDRIAAVRSRIE